MLLTAASVQAAPETIGQLAPDNPPAYCVHGPYDSVPIGPAAATYTVSAPGVITSWSTNATAGAGQTLTFKVYRSLGSEKYLVVGHDGPQTLTPSTLNTFKTSISVQAGDLIGVDDDNAEVVPNACAFKTGTLTDHAAFAKGEAADGAIATMEGFEEEARNNLTAIVLSPPALASLTPAKGSIRGGTSVTITGTNFTEASAVKFGSAAASSFTVNSDTQITATAPSSSAPGPLSVVVTTVAGTATSPQQFTYTACVVPKLTGKKLKVAKKALAKAECKLGKVKKLKGATTKTGKVKKQSPKPGKILAPGSKVSVKLG